MNYLKKQNGAQPTQKELADYVKIPEDELADILYMIDKAKKDVYKRQECPRDAVEAGSVHYTCGRGWHKSAYHRLQWRSNLP